MKKPHKIVSSLQHQLKEFNTTHARLETELEQLQANEVSRITHAARIKEIKATKCSLRTKISAIENRLQPRIVAHGSRHAQRAGTSLGTSAVA